MRPGSNDIGIRRVLVHQHLVAQAHSFMSNPARKAEFCDPNIPAYLTHVLHAEGLIAFNRRVREAILSLKTGVSTGPFWALVDATGFWEDTTPGKWSHITPERISTLLEWAESYQSGQDCMREEAQAA